MESLQDLFNYVAEQMPGVRDFLFRHTIKTPLWAIFGAVALMGYQAVSKRKAMKALQKGSLTGSTAVLGYTTYSVSGKINTDNGDEFLDQDLVTIDTIDIGQFYHPKIRKVIIDTLNRAAKLCTDEEPSPFQHLSKVLKGNDSKKTRVMDEIKRGWINGFSRLMQDPDFFPLRFGTEQPTDTVFDSAPERQRPEKNSLFPILIWEPSSYRKQYRVLLFTEDMIKQTLDVEPENVRVHVGGGRYIKDPENHLNVRVATNKALANHVTSNREFWEDNFAPLFETGRFKHVPTPISEHDRADKADKPLTLD